MIKTYETGNYSLEIRVENESITGVELFFLHEGEPPFGIGSDAHPLMDNAGRRYDLTPYITRLELASSTKTRNQVLTEMKHLLIEVAASHDVSPGLLTDLLR